MSLELGVASLAIPRILLAVVVLCESCTGSCRLQLLAIVANAIFSCAFPGFIFTSCACTNQPTSTQGATHRRKAKSALPHLPIRRHGRQSYLPWHVQREGCLGRSIQAASGVSVEGLRR